MVVYSAKLVKAFAYAFEKHKDQIRKGTEIPYIVHPMDVASILMKHNAPEPVVIAGILHDVVEDTDTSLEEIEKEFGISVAGLVQMASEPEHLRENEDAQHSWEKRKIHTINKVKTLSYSARLLVCADKLANMRDIYRDYKIKGELTWSRFNAPKEKQAWYYSSLVKVLAEDNSIEKEAVYIEFNSYVEALFKVSSPQ